MKCLSNFYREKVIHNSTKNSSVLRKHSFVHLCLLGMFLDQGKQKISLWICWNEKEKGMSFLQGNFCLHSLQIMLYFWVWHYFSSPKLIYNDDVHVICYLSVNKEGIFHSFENHRLYMTDWESYYLVIRMWKHFKAILCLVWLQQTLYLLRR